jgi:hypothetical protein
MDALFQVLVAIDRCDTPAGGAVFGVSQALFFQNILLDMVGQADHSPVADAQLLRRNGYAGDGVR